MAFREVSVYEVREVLRLWLTGRGFRAIARVGPVDRKAVRRYVEAAITLGLTQQSDPAALTDELIGEIVQIVRPARPNGKGATWELIAKHHDRIKVWVERDHLKVTKVLDKLEAKTGAQIPYSTLHRYCCQHFDTGKRRSTVRVDDCEPGAELQADFGRMGLLFDPVSCRNRVVWALAFTPVFSRYTFVWLSFRQTLEVVIAWLEAAWRFYDGVFAVVIPDNLKAIVVGADDLDPRLNPAFLEYAQSRGFVIDPARIGRAQDKARVERVVPFVRDSFFKGELFADLADAQRRAELWCQGRAGMRIHGTTQARPKEQFEQLEQPYLLPAPTAAYDLPIYGEAKVHRDHHIEFARSLYSIPGSLIGQTLNVGADRSLVKVYLRGQLVKTHPRMQPGRRSTDPEDLPQEETTYAMRDLDKLQAKAADHGEAIGRFCAALLDSPLPWTKMGQAYRLLGLVRQFGAKPTNEACAQALAYEAIDVNLVSRVLEQALETMHHEQGLSPEPRWCPCALPVRPVSLLLASKTAMNEAISADLKATLRRLRLSPMLDTLPERLSIARQSSMAHQDFLQLILSDEVSRRDRVSARLRARNARLDRPCGWRTGTTRPLLASTGCCGRSFAPCALSRTITTA